MHKASVQIWILTLPWSCRELLFNSATLALHIEAAIVGWMTHRWTWHANKDMFNELRRASEHKSGQT